VHTPFADLVDVRPTGVDGRFHVDPPGSGFLFGGLTLALALTGAARTVADDLVPLSLRCTFVTFGEWGATDIDVEDIATSRSFATRRVSLRQRTDDGGEKVVAVADAAFHRPEDGPDVHDAPVPAPDPATLPSAPTRFGTVEGETDPFDVRPLDPARRSGVERIHPYWTRAWLPVAGGSSEHSAALAFMSDYYVIHTPFEPGSGASEGLRSFTLEQSLWFHRACDANRWMLFDCSPLTQSHGRYTSRGTVHDEDGALVASFAQVGFIRPAR